MTPQHPATEDYVRATAEALGLNPDAAVAHLDQTLAALRKAEPMTPQHPAAPETETDANGLTEAERESMSEAGLGRRFRMNALQVLTVERILAARHAAILADLNAARERVRVVEGERDAEVAEAEREHEKTLAIMEAACDRSDAATLRAESAEAAHEAEKAAHERLRAGVAEIASAITLTAKQVREQGDVRQVVLGDDGVDEGPTLADELWAFGFNLTTLLGGGGAR